MHSSLLIFLAALLGLAPVGTASGQSNVSGLVTLEGRPLIDAVVELLGSSGSTDSLSVDTVMIDQSHLEFLPALVTVRPGGSVEFRNSDPILHNVFSPRRGGADFDLGTYPQDNSRYRSFDEPGSYVILCHVHPEMAAWVVVVQTAHTATTDRDGRYSIPDVPNGRYRVRVRHRRTARTIQDVQVPPGPTFDLNLPLTEPRR